MTNIILILTTTTTGLMAGLFFAWSCSVIPGLARLPDAGYLAAMQAMNRAILNPLFLAAFIGTLLLLPLSTILHYGRPAPARFWLLLAAAIVYAVGVFGVTMAGNVPLNETLDAFNLGSASASDLAAQRAAFERPWNDLHLIRTWASTLSLLLAIIACRHPT